MWSAQVPVERLLEERVPFGWIEDFIESRRDLSHDDRNALWLYAWAREQESATKPIQCRW